MAQGWTFQRGELTGASFERALHVEAMDVEH